MLSAGYLPVTTRGSLASARTAGWVFTITTLIFLSDVIEHSQGVQNELCLLFSWARKQRHKRSLLSSDQPNRTFLTDFYLIRLQRSRSLMDRNSETDKLELLKPGNNVIVNFIFMAIFNKSKAGLKKQKKINSKSIK